MKTSAKAEEVLLLGACAAALKRKRRHSIYKPVIPVRTSVYQRKKRVCKTLVSLYVRYFRKVQMKARPTRPGRRWWVRPIFQDHDRHGAWAALIPTTRKSDPDKFYNFLRMTPESFHKLLQIAGRHMQKVSWRKNISPGERLCITLRYLASGCTMVALSYLFRVSHQCISSIVFETTAILWAVLQKDAFPQSTKELWLQVATDFERMWNIPNCLGAIDGKHVAVRAFPHCGSRYYNYKKFHSMVLMAVSDAKLRCLVVDFGACGRRGDSNVFYHSTFGRALRNNTLNIPPPCRVDGSDSPLPFVFVGDNAFARSENLIVPFKGSFLLPEERLYNYRLSRARRVIKNLFGVLSSRQRILLSSITGSEALVKSIVLCCVALHNWHLMEEERLHPNERRYCPEGFSDHVSPSGQYIEGQWRKYADVEEEKVLKKLLLGDGKPVSLQAQLEGDEVTMRFMEYFAKKSVPWQWRKIFLP